MTGQLVIVGDALLDRDVNGRAERLCPDAPAPVLEDPREVLRPGGAALAATLAVAAGAAPALVAPLNDGDASMAVRSLLPPGVRVEPLAAIECGGEDALPGGRKDRARGGPARRDARDTG